MYLGEGVEFWNARRIWCLTKPFFSNFVYVIPVVEIVNELLYFTVCVNYHGCRKRPVVVSVIQLDLAFVYFILRIHDYSRCAFVGLFDVYFSVAFQGFESLALGW